MFREESLWIKNAIQKLKLTLIGGKLSGQATQWTISAPTLESDNVADKGYPIALKESVASATDGTLTLAPITVNVFKFNLDKTITK